MEINYTITKDEIVNFHVKYINKTAIYKKVMWLMPFMWWVGALIVIRFFSDKYYTILIIIFVLICSIFRKKICLSMLKKKFMEYYSLDKYRNMFEATTIKINDVGINCTTKLSTKLYKWDGIESIYIVNSYLFVQTLMNEDLFIPLGIAEDLVKKRSTIEDIVKNSHKSIIYQYPIKIKYF